MDDSVQLSELSPVGGSFSGRLFENRFLGYGPALTWTFDIDFAEVHRDRDSTKTILSVDWVPANGESWHALAGRTYSCTTFGERVESSIYFNSTDYRFDAANLLVSQQESDRIKVEAHISGDIDSLGIPSFSVETELSFAGIIVALDDVGVDIPLAKRRLEEHTDATGLIGRDRGHYVIFERPDE